MVAGLAGWRAFGIYVISIITIITAITIITGFWNQSVAYKEETPEMDDSKNGDYKLGIILYLDVVFSEQCLVEINCINIL